MSDRIKIKRFLGWLLTLVFFVNYSGFSAYAQAPQPVQREDSRTGENATSNGSDFGHTDYRRIKRDALVGYDDYRKTNDISQPGAPRAPAETPAAQAAFLWLFDWKKVDGYAIATFAIENTADRLILSSTLECRFSGPLVGSHQLPSVYGHSVIRAHQTRSFGPVNLGLVADATAVNCLLGNIEWGEPTK